MHRLLSPTLAARLDTRRDMSGGPDSCWPQTWGAPGIGTGPRGKHTLSLRHAVWLVEHGELPVRYAHVELSCKTPRCLNPRHLYIQTEEQRFWSKVDKSGGERACWIWTGTKSYHGQYGQFQFNKRADGTVRAHRQAWEYVKKEKLPPEVFLCHHCDTPLCVNPAHLFPGSPKDNCEDMWKKGRGSCGPQHGARVKAARAKKMAIAPFDSCPSGGPSDG